MSEDDRAARAARAKAMLKKRQQKKSAGGSALASPPPSRLSTPVPQEAAPVAGDTGKNDVADLFTPADSDANWIESLPRVDVAQSMASGTFSTPPPSQVPASPSHASDYTIASTLVNSSSSSSYSNEKVLEAGSRSQIKELEGERSALQLQLRQEQQRAQDALRHVEVATQEKRSMEEMYRSSQAEILQLKSQCDEIRSYHKELQTENMQINERHAQELYSQHRMANSHKEEAKRLSEQLDAARVEIQDLHSKEADSARRWNEQDENRQQTIALLVSEKTSLLASVARLEKFEIEAQEQGELLQAERIRSESLDARVQDLERSSSQLSKQLQEALVGERELAEKSRDQERELQLLNASLEEARSASEQHQRLVRELEEQIQSDDRAERLEESLKNTQDRAEELEFQLSKLKQTLASVKREKDEVQSQLQLRTDGEAEWMAKHATLEQQHSSIQAHLHSVTQDRDASFEERASLQSQVDFNQSAIKQLQQKLGEVASELSSTDRALQNAHGDLRAANRRAEEAERTQKDLQKEGTRLMQSLDEMRPKFVELTSNKMELMEQIDKLEHEKNSRDAFIVKLEFALSEATEREAEAAKAQKDANLLQQKDNVSLQRTIAELQQGYAELQAELETSRAAVLSLEGDRTQLRQIEARQLEIIDRLSTESHQHSQAMSRLESKLQSYRNLVEEHQSFAEQSNSQIEALQAELSAKDDEIEHLRTAFSSDEAPPRSLDDEMLGAVKVQHAMDLSNAQSHIRTLETAVFEAQAKSHNLQKQVSLLEDQLAQQRSVSRATSRSFTPGVPGRPASRSHTDSRRGSFAHRPSHLAPPSPRTVFDVGLSPETRHKRQVSLSMLKARIDSEAATSAAGHSLSRKLSPVLQENEGPSAREVYVPSYTEHSQRRQQFMDESHIFWCHACRGDLIIL